MITPGPWKVTRYDDGLLICYTEGATICFGDRNHTALSDEANFALIAAAPDLLEALKAVVRVADRATVEFDLARAAIAKAEGR